MSRAPMPAQNVITVFYSEPSLGFAFRPLCQAAMHDEYLARLRQDPRAIHRPGWTMSAGSGSPRTSSGTPQSADARKSTG